SCRSAFFNSIDRAPVAGPDRRSSSLPASLSLRQMSFPIRNFASLRALLAGLFLACGIALPAAAASSFDLALADQSDFLQRPGGRAVTDESDSSSPIPLPGALPRAVPRV